MKTTLPPYYVLSEDAISTAWSTGPEHGALFMELIRQRVLDGTTNFEPSALVNRLVAVLNRHPERIHELLNDLVAARLLAHTRLGYSMTGWDAWQQLPFAAEADRVANYRAGALRRWHAAGNHTTPKAGCDLCATDGAA